MLTASSPHSSWNLSSWTWFCTLSQTWILSLWCGLVLLRFLLNTHMHTSIHHTTATTVLGIFMVLSFSRPSQASFSCQWGVSSLIVPFLTQKWAAVWIELSFSHPLRLFCVLVFALHSMIGNSYYLSVPSWDYMSGTKWHRKNMKHRSRM